MSFRSCSLPAEGCWRVFFRFFKLRRKVLIEDVQQALYECLEEQAGSSRPGGVYLGIGSAELALKSGKSLSQVKSALAEMVRQKIVAERAKADGSSTWTFTPDGLKNSYLLVLNQRLWDLYHMNQNEYHHVHIDQSQEELAPQLTEEMLAKMLAQLEAYDLTPKLTEGTQAISRLYASEQGGLSL